MYFTGGTKEDGTPNLKFFKFTQDGNNFSRYSSTHQSSVEQGSLMRYYRENFENLKCFGNDVPHFLYKQFKEWAFILGM